MSNINDKPFEARLTGEFSAWLDGLADDVAAAAVAERLLRIGRGLFGDYASVGGRVSELRIHYGPGLRVYFTVRRQVVVIMLEQAARYWNRAACSRFLFSHRLSGKPVPTFPHDAPGGGSKRTQARDIRRARALERQV